MIAGAPRRTARARLEIEREVGALDGQPVAVDAGEDRRRLIENPAHAREPSLAFDVAQVPGDFDRSKHLGGGTYAQLVVRQFAERTLQGLRCRGEPFEESYTIMRFH